MDILIEIILIYHFIGISMIYLTFLDKDQYVEIFLHISKILKWLFTSDSILILNINCTTFFQ